jgi:hypothetical protein
MLRSKLPVGVMLLALTAQASAVDISAAFTQQSGNTWQVDLAVINNGGVPAGIEEFTLWFPQTLYSNLILVASPATWDSIVAQPLPAPVSSSGYLDSLVIAPTPALALGQTQSGFALKFAFLGNGTPAGLQFDIVDPTTFAPIASGVTIPVPEPGTLGQMLAGAGALAWFISRRRIAARGGRS